MEESKNVQTTPPATTESAICPCPTIIQIVGLPGTGKLPRTIAPPDTPRLHSEPMRKSHMVTNQMVRALKSKAKFVSHLNIYNSEMFET